ncbi:MAG: 16S rRNA (guanine(966)-N(2))-methyltransferase RsmD [Nitrospinaceae bacterium]|nr:16S rRNA (guanine(966)-N(2))-methyltransferase RsmD [Nitrospinaceae bacterium]NIR56128.1 16S rRNA (guanine(966)-N(2))-methyltransferase RsmD [Nitrospinaceae bacterium]NIS86576.1 16S rRNA (guanine(966)-N(2))-methyltransferase RsmD [Nitrospinaceae bacterium]NIT83410.1 16S rRNA (guanine(966)-N(2))-methyltransferase RsmD [Nitrospinaceae bacterium]NIU45620.1 16S rRNA (guanine(966)-N(2))-methyltransferase RsmD [Nitrospinaceae bacterium]
MRVIAGSAKSTPLASLKGAKLRPTLDRVRESLFNQIAGEIEGARFLDLFAGSGAMGIEALSRGAAEVVFVELNSRAQAIIYQNLVKCRFLDPEAPEKKSKHWILLKSNVLHALKLLTERHHQFDWVYLDPPYADNVYEETLTALAHSPVLDESATVIAEHHHKTSLAENYGRLILNKTRRIGDTCLSFYGFAERAKT